MQKLLLKDIKNLPFFKNQTLLSCKLFKVQGLCNTNYKIKTDKNIYVLRVFNLNSNVNINRKFEYKAQKTAYKKGISPKVFYFNKKKYMITHFIKGIHKKKLNLKDIKKLVKIVKKTHSLKICSKKYDFYKDLNYYKDKLKGKKNKKYIYNLLKNLKKSEKFKKEFALCHHDLNIKNIIFTKKSIKIIDWEYAKVNDIYFDLAAICVEFKLSNKKIKILLKTYFKKVKNKNRKKLHIYKKIYSLLCKLWLKDNF